MKIVINKSSWHYRWYKWLYEKIETNNNFQPSSSICGYFWGGVWTNIKASGIGLIIVLLLGVVCSLLAAPFITALSFFFDEFLSKKLIEFFHLFAVLDVIIFVVFSFLFIRENVQEVIKAKDGSSFTGVVVTTFSSIKNRVCPLVEYKEG